MLVLKLTLKPNLFSASMPTRGAIENNARTQTHLEAKSLLCQHSHKGSGTGSNSALKAPVKGEDQVAHVGRHNVCKGWVVAGRPGPAAQAVHGHQSTCIQGNTAGFAIFWKTLRSPHSLYAKRSICKDISEPSCVMKWTENNLIKW